MRRAILLAGMVMMLLLAPSVAGAATITVTFTSDEFGTGQFCALREAVQAANTDADFGGCSREGTGTRDTILLEGGETYARGIDADFEDANAGGDLDITGNTKIRVSGDTMATIDANDMDRAIDVRPGGSLTGSRLVILDGELSPTAFADNAGGGIRVSGGAVLKLSRSIVLSNEILGTNGRPHGGGIIAAGVARLDRVLLSENSARLGGGMALSSGQLTLSRSTVDLNTSALAGGGVYLAGAGNSSARIDRSTISRNHSFATTSGLGGAGIYSTGQEGDDFRVVNTTISGNNSNSAGGGIFVNTGDLQVNAATITNNTADYEEGGTAHGGGVAGGFGHYDNSIIADNINPLAPGNEEDCDPNADPIKGKLNLVGDDTGCKENGNVVTADPKLEALGDFGGPTFTHKLLKGSKAIGRAANSAPPKDQRGHARDADPDIGAYERG